jgi:type II secretory pathway pseudopilin PulG
MRRRFNSHDRGAFTLVEIMIAAAVATVVGLAIFTSIYTAMLMAARNLSVNLTNNSERKALDRIEQVIQQANTMPTLITNTGAAATSPAAGVTFDYYLGGPYVLTVSGSTVPATTTSLAIVRSTNVVASPPLPNPGDVLMINGAPSSIRARISTVVVGATNGSAQQTITVTLANQLGAAVPIPTSGILTAYLVRMVAFIVMPEGTGQELHYYGSYETTTNLYDPTQYIMLTDQVGLLSGAATPFSLIQIQSASFVGLAFQVRSNQFDQRLNKKQADQFNTFARVDVYIRPKINPP